MTKDNLIDCPLCSEPGACYASIINEANKMSYFCFGCGYHSNDLMISGEFDTDDYEKQLPELYKDIKRVDNDNRVWYPTAINLQEKGTVFANGKNPDEWQWAAIKNIPLSEEDKEKLIFKGKTHKSDSKSLKNFGKDFLSALEYIEVEI